MELPYKVLVVTMWFINQQKRCKSVESSSYHIHFYTFFASFLFPIPCSLFPVPYSLKVLISHKLNHIARLFRITYPSKIS